MYKVRELSIKDIEIINGWRNDSELINNLGAPFRYINKEVDSKWYENYMNNRTNNIRLALVTEENDKILGLISLTNIDFVFRSAELHIMIGNIKDRGKGLGTFALDKMLYHAFRNLNLNRVELSLLATNNAKLLYEKKGFEVEGIKREAAYKNGNYIDVIEMAILRKRYDEINGEN